MVQHFDTKYIHTYLKLSVDKEFEDVFLCKLLKMLS